MLKDHLLWLLGPSSLIIRYLDPLGHIPDSHLNPFGFTPKKPQERLSRRKSPRAQLSRQVRHFQEVRCGFCPTWRLAGLSNYEHIAGLTTLLVIGVSYP